MSKMLEFETKCRLCANVTSVRTTLFLYSENTEQLIIQLPEVIHNCLGITISEDDQLPKIICTKCYRIIQKIIDFRDSCHLAEIKLREELETIVKPDREINDYFNIKDEEYDNNVSEITEMFCEPIIDIIKSDIECDDSSWRNKYNTASDSNLDEDIKLFNSTGNNNEVNIENSGNTENKITKKRFKYKKGVKQRNIKKPVERRKQVHALKVCEYCGKVTRNINQHMDVHSKTRYTCTMCTNSYSDRSTLKRHLLTHDEKKFSCEYCNMRFSCNGYLKRHLIIHTGERKHVCDICSKAFQTRYNLKTHFRTHTKEKPFKCSNCAMAFAHRATFNIHTKDCGK